MNLINNLIKDRWLKTPKIIEAFSKIKREDFLPEDMKNFADINEALPIGYGQTISQPLVVAFMLEELNPVPGDKILDVGAGSGWTTALLAEIVGEEGKVTAVEVIPELKEFGEKNVSKYNFIKKDIVEFICDDGSKGYKEGSPYNKILVSATAQKVYKEWKEQLEINGRIVVPMKSSIWVLAKKDEKEFEEKENPGFVFVPLIPK